MTSTILFALVLERRPFLLSDVPIGIVAWLQVAGGFCALGILIFVIKWLATRGRSPSRGAETRASQGLLASVAQSALRGRWSRWVRPAFISCAALSLVSYLVVGGLWLSELTNYFTGSKQQLEPPSTDKVQATVIGIAVGGGLALIAALLPFLDDVRKLRGRRIWGLAKLSYKEAVRKRILYLFFFLLMVGLFMSWFVQSKPEDQLRTYVQVVDWAMIPLLLVSAVLLAALSIPTDIKQQTIHTITTKPVERFEILAGRFLGYYLLMTVVLFVTTTVSLFFVLRGLNPKAEQESLKARDPIYGKLYFIMEDSKGIERPHEGTNVGRVWGYRGYVQGIGRLVTDRHYAVWNFDRIPEDLEGRSTIQCETTFDIYRTNKGRENVPVACTFQFETRHFDKRNRQKFLSELRAGAADKATEQHTNDLCKKYGYYEKPGVVIVDYHTATIDLPVGLLENALGDQPAEGELPEGSNRNYLMRVRVRCDSSGQLVGMNEYDLYLRNDDPKRGSDTLDFVLNYYKGALGLWLRIGLVIGLSVALSTRLGGIITALTVMLIYLGGVFRIAIYQVVAGGAAAGGGATESAYRLFTRTKNAMPLDEGAASTSVIQAADKVLGTLLTPVLYLLPDVERFDFSNKVANGFSVGLVSQDFLPAFLMLIAYLIPWGLLGYYVMKGREIAGPH